MERAEEAFPAAQRPPVVAPRNDERPATATQARPRAASTADRLLIASSLLLVVSAAGLATGSRYEPIFLGVFVLGLILTLVARRMLSQDERARRTSDR